MWKLVAETSALAFITDFWRQAALCMTCRSSTSPNLSSMSLTFTTPGGGKPPSASAYSSGGPCARNGQQPKNMSLGFEEIPAAPYLLVEFPFQAR